MSKTTEKPQSKKSGCLMAAAAVMMVALLAILGVFFVTKRALSDFDAHRELMCLRPGLAVSDAHLRYSPGMDAAMWSKFTVKVKGIEEVFDASRVDIAAFSEDDYSFGVDWIDSSWWDVDKRRLIGGEADVGGNFMRVGYVDNGDGTLTVYVFWFEV